MMSSDAIQWLISYRELRMMMMMVMMMMMMRVRVRMVVVVVMFDERLMGV